MVETHRNYLIDNSKGILIFLVVLGHSLEFLRKDYDIVRIMYTFVYLFHMPVFVFISGYLSKNIEKGRKNAVKTLFIPFLFFNTIWNVVEMYLQYFPGNNAGEITNITLFSFFTPGWALWYIFSMFLWKIFLPDLLKIKNIFIISIIVGIAARLFSELGTFMALSRTLSFTPFFLAGYYTSEKKLHELRKFGQVPSILITGIGIALAILFVKLFNIPGEFLWADRSYNHFEIGIIKSVILATLNYGIGFLFIYVFANLVPKKETFLCKLGRNTLSVYLLHTYFIGVVLGVCSLIPSDIVKFIIIIIGTFIITFLLSRDVVAIRFNCFLNGINKKIFAEEK